MKIATRTAMGAGLMLVILLGLAYAACDAGIGGNATSMLPAMLIALLGAVIIAAFKALPGTRALAATGSGRRCAAPPARSGAASRSDASPPRIDTGAAPDRIAPNGAPPMALRILVVEDDQVQGALLVFALQDLGLSQVALARTGVQALAMVEAAPARFDLVITGLNTGELDCIQFLQRAARHGCGVILSAPDAPALLDCIGTVLRHAGIALLGVLARPLDPQQLHALLARQVSALSAPPAASLAYPVTPPPVTRGDLIHALATRQFVPYFQPKIDLPTDRPCGVEVLARWVHPTRGLIAAVDFIEQMEQEGLIDALTDCIFRQALEWAQRWSQHGIEGDLAMNLSVHTLHDPRAPYRLLNMAREHGIAAERITFEMTETAFARDQTRLLASLTRLRLHGFKLSIDDFGIGYSSLKQLAELPFTELKIDRCFVSGMLATGKAMPIVETLIALCTRLGLGVVAEGIENQIQRDLLTALGCHTGQGNFIGAALPGSAVPAWYVGRRAPSDFSVLATF